jgi:uncharacterized membrane protein YphA (DoxX/SURF4 family)
MDVTMKSSMVQTNETERLRIAVALLRITLGTIILATWIDNLSKGLYSASGLADFLNWLADPNGNGGTLGFYHAFVEAAVIPIAGVLGPLQMVAEFIMGLALLVGGLTRLFGLVAALFFFNLFLAYFGGDEWIWTYVLLFMSALTVALGAAGRKWGLDALLRQKWGSDNRLSFWY